MRSQLEVEEKETDIIELISSKFLPYWPLYVILVFLSLGSAFVYLRYVTPIYQASAKLIIKDESKGGGSEDSYINASLNLIDSKKNIENEMEVLKSRALMEKVVKSLYLTAPVTQEGKVKEGDAYAISPVMIEVKDIESAKEVKKVGFSYDRKGRTVVLSGKYRYPMNEYVKTPYGVLKFIPNKHNPNATTVNKKPLYFSIDDFESTVLNYMAGLSITPNKQSAIVDIVYRDPIPQRAVDIINHLISIYDEVSISEKNQLARNTLAFVESQLNQVSAELDSIEKNVQQFKSGSNAVDIGAQGTKYLENVSENDQKLGDINLQLSILDEVDKYLKSNQNGQLLAPSTLGLKDPSLSSLFTQLQTAEIEYERLQKTVGKNNPSLITIAAQINKLRPAITENIQSQRRTLEATKSSLLSTNSGYNSMLSSVPKKEKQLLEISREQLTKKDQYLFLLQKKQEAEMSVASVVSNSRLVDNAIASRFPVSPKKSMIYIIALAVGFGLAFGFIFLKDMMTSKIKYRREIEKYTTVPIIGEIGFEKTKNPLVVVKGERSFIAEEFRKLRIALNFIGIDSSHRKLLLTSSISGEGKSFIAANLAASVSLVGKRIVLVDLDLNQPTLSEILDVDYEFGVSDYLSGEKQPEEIINKLESHENLYFISSGPLVDNPSELLANGRVKELISYLDNNFDMVIVDTSPAVLVTDAYILSGLCDATIYVVRHDYTPKEIVEGLDENSQVTPLKNPAIVFNGLKKRGVLKNKYGYGNRYVYGGKYGGLDKQKKGRKAS